MVVMLCIERVLRIPMLHFYNPKGGRASVCAAVFVFSSFMGYKNVTREVVNVCRYCVSDPFVFVGYIFVTREFGC